MPLPHRKHVPLRLPPDWDERLQAIAERNGLTKQAWVMGVVREAIEQAESEIAIASPKGKKEKLRASSSTERPGLGIANLFADPPTKTEEPPPPKVPAGVNVYVGASSADSRQDLDRYASYIVKVEEPERESRLREIKKILQATCQDDFEFRDTLHKLEEAIAKRVQARGESPLKGFWNGVQRLLT